MGRRAFGIERTVMELIKSDDLARKKQLAKKIFDVAYKEGIFPASIHEFYMARGRGEFSGFTVPAINLRSMTYDLARKIFRVAKRNNSGAFIFEIARSEIGYTNQSPIEYSSVVLAAAIKEGYSGPIFIQGDHFQVNAAKFRENPDKVKKSIKDRGMSLDIDELLALDKKRRELLTEADKLKNERNIASEEIARLKRENRDVGPKLAKMKTVSQKIKQIDTKVVEIDKKIANIMRSRNYVFLK